jgi:hypothetical protein
MKQKKPITLFICLFLSLYQICSMCLAGRGRGREIETDHPTMITLKIQMKKFPFKKAGSKLGTGGSHL